MKYLRKNKNDDVSITTKKNKMKRVKKEKSAQVPSFDDALAAHPKEATKYFGDEGKDKEHDDKKTKGKKGKKGSGSVGYANKSANLGAYVV